MASTPLRTLCVVLAIGVLCVGAHKQAQAATWTTIAKEKQSFIVNNKTVRYGSGSTWITKKVTAKGMCTNAFFGRDPLKGVRKECQISKPKAATAPPLPVADYKQQSSIVNLPKSSYALTIADPVNGRVLGAVSGAKYARGTSVTLTAVAEGAYGIKGWTGAAASCGASPTCKIDMASDKTVGVTFKTMPVGFGAGTTGGAGGEVVTVSTTQALKDALCNKFDAAGVCIDNTRRIVQLTSVIDFTGTDGKSTAWICKKNKDEVCKTQEMTIDYPDLKTCHAEGARLDDGSPDPIARKRMAYDTAGTKPLRVGSNKTVVGIGTKAGIKGKGLMVAGVSNVVIRNLSLTDMNAWLVWGGDAITIDGASNVWIDHNHFARIGRQFIVTGWGAATNLTISNNFFDGANDYAFNCDGKHYWSLLLGGKDENATLIANRFANVSGRSPEVGNTGATFHIVNNLWDDNNTGIMVSPVQTAVTFLEGNYFTPTMERLMPVAIEFPQKDHPEKILRPFPVYAPMDQTIDMANPTCLAMLGRNCSSNYATLTSFGVDTLKGLILDPKAINMLKATPAIAHSMGLLQPMPYAKVAAHVKAKAGPQADPDQ